MAWILGFFCMFPWPRLAQTAPAQDRNLTALGTDVAPSWVSDPDDRGTWSLLYSCVFTLILCVWTAVHPNLPSRDLHASVMRYNPKILFVLYALLAPEFGILTAFEQYQRAKRLIGELSKLKAEHVAKHSSLSSLPGNAAIKETDPEAHVSQCSYSMVYGFYVIMGGLAVNISPIHDKLQILPLSPHGVIHLARKGHFIDVSDTEINDKSKANILAKGLVLVQISFTMFSCIARKAVGLPVSVLEVHTLIHAGCALVMYCLWLKKPMEVEEPIIISTEDFESDIALMLVRTQGSGVQPMGNLVLPTEFESARYAGSKYRDWPGHLASEASYLVFDPSKNGEKGTLSTASSGNGQDSREGCAPNEHTMENTSPAATETLTTISRTNDSLRPGLPSDASRMETSSSQGHKINTTAKAEYQGNRLVKFIAPVVYARRQAAYLYRTSRLVDPAGPKELHGCDVWAGFHVCPPLGVPHQLSVSTGDIVPGGIGPNALMVGSWTGLTAEGQIQTPIVVLEVAENVRHRLPCHNTRRSTVKFYSPLKISLSSKDLRRWRLAGAALRAEYASSSMSADDSRCDDTRYVDFSDPESRAYNVFFLTIALTRQNNTLSEFFGIHSADDGERILLFVQRVLGQLNQMRRRRWIASIVASNTVVALYAALHLALWGYRFPTRVERILWRVSASALLAAPTVVLLALGLILAWRRLAPHVFGIKLLPVDESSAATTAAAASSNTNNTSITNTTSTTNTTNSTNATDSDELHFSTAFKAAVAFAAAAAWLLGPLYLFSRTFIVAESFLSLRRVPVGVYVGVGWARYIPHM
ncbi:MAG: hypothetical protein Q9173_007154 [Seirophora scorigena]